MALYQWDIETYRARYNAYETSGGPGVYSFIEMESEHLSHGIHATVFVWFVSNPTTTGSVSLPSYDGSDWDYEYYLFLAADQFDTLREFLDSERPIRFEAVHDSAPVGTIREVRSWSLNTESGEPVGEEEGKKGYLRWLSVAPEELRPEELQDTLETLGDDVEVEAPGRERGSAAG